MDKKKLQAAGFSPARRSPRRIHAMVNGLQKVGKTRLGLGAPPPVGYIGIELAGEEGVIDQFIPEGQEENPNLQVAHIYVPEFETGAIGKNEDKEWMARNQDLANEALDQFYKAYEFSLAGMKTTVIDGGTDVWELIRYAYAGRIEKVPQLAYGEMNREFNRILDMASAAKGNVLWLHRMKEVWENYVDDKGKQQGRRTGTFEFAGYKDTPFKVQAVIEMWKEELTEPDENTGRMVKFKAEITDSRFNADAMGMTFEDDDVSFANIASIITGSDIAEWQ